LYGAFVVKRNFGHLDLFLPRREYRGEVLAFRVPKWAETL